MRSERSAYFLYQAVIAAVKTGDLCPRCCLSPLTLPEDRSRSALWVRGTGVSSGISADDDCNFLVLNDSSSSFDVAAVDCDGRDRDDSSLATAL